MNARLDNALTGADPLLRGVVITSVVGLGTPPARRSPPSRRSQTSAHAGRSLPPTGAARCIGWP
jgi:hypothetical protein